MKRFLSLSNKRTVTIRRAILAGMILLLSGCIADEVGGIWLVTEEFSELPSSKDYAVEVLFQAGDNWQAWSSDGWLTVTPTEGKSGRNGIRLRTASANRTRERRKATVTIASGGKQQTVTLWQRNDYALFDQREYTVDANGGEVKMTFQSNVAKDSLLIMYLKLGWYAWDADSLSTTRAADWHGGVKTLYVSPNLRGTERSSYFMLVKSADRRIDYQVLDTTWVRQAGDTLSASGEPVFMP
jgi:hypothetical protein